MSIAVLVSGGLDSYIAWRLAPPQDRKAVWVDLGQPYANKEWRAISELNIPAVRVQIKNFYPNPITIENAEIPGRNLLLALAGAQHGEEVWLSALEGEMHPWTRDKTLEFFYMASSMLTYILHSTRPETVVITPFKGLTKTDIVAEALQSGISAEEMKQTSSCYHESLKSCGICGTCFKRWIAMTNNGIQEEYHQAPWASEYATNLRQAMIMAIDAQDFSHYSLRRISETTRALYTIGLSL